MDFSTTEEKRIAPAQTYSTPAHECTIRRINGPCIVCERQIEYPGPWPSTEEHARKQFMRRRRDQILQKLRGGGRLGDVPKVETIEGMACTQCRTECKQQREAAERQRQAEAQKKQREVEQKRLARLRHYEWRTATASDVDPTPQSAEFRAVFPNFEMHEILFRWHAVPGKCRGDSYLMVVGMWVDGKLTAHYYGWNLQWLDLNEEHQFYGSEDEWATEDLFGLGFCRWIERAFQPRLLRHKPDQTWAPGGYEELDTSVVRDRPGTVRIEWIDGSRYVHLLPSKNLPEVAEWAEKNLELRIEERAFRPLPPRRDV